MPLIIDAEDCLTLAGLPILLKERPDDCEIFMLVKNALKRIYIENKGNLLSMGRKNLP